jgi:hypothetical protein
MKKIILSITLALAMVFGFSACTDDDADVVSENISKDADNFKVLRRTVFYNGITDTYMLELTGFCNIEDDGQQLEVTCKVGDGAYKKHFLRVSDNATYFVEQLSDSNVSADFYKVTFKPSTIIPDVDVR